MAYQRNDINCDPAGSQPGSTTVNHFSGNEGWATKTFKNWNADYQARKSDNSTRTPGTFQARLIDNNTRTPSAYQRKDKDNATVSA
tara:strand:+ start:95 stop:352 length:258 start_codon:yes stop_codon:yes gene_type:complete